MRKDSFPATDSGSLFSPNSNSSTQKLKANPETMGRKAGMEQGAGRDR